MNRRFGHIALLVMMAAGMGSCDRDATQEGGGEVPVPENLSPIAFSANEQEEQTVTRAGMKDETVTRATNLGTITPTFTVYGFKNMGYNSGTNAYTDLQIVFPGYTVNWVENTAGTSTTNSHNWEYVGLQRADQTTQTIKYWDLSAMAYRFGGYAGTGVTVSDVTTSSENITFTFAADATNTYTIDATPYYCHLWFHTPDDQVFGQAVTLEFLKPFTRVRFGFVSDDPTEMPLSDIDIAHPVFKPTNDQQKVGRSATATVTYPLTGTGTKEELTFSGITSIDGFDNYFLLDPTRHDADRVTGTDYWYTVLPAANQGTYTLTVSINGEDQACYVPAEYMNWLPSYEYTYLFKIHADNGVSIGAVQSAFTPWSDLVSIDYPVYNW